MILISEDKNSKVTIEKGELVSYLVNNEELIHQKGNPGWRNSDTEMFPIIGPTEALNFTVATPKGNYNQDQHGLLRELQYALESNTENSCVFVKKYAAYTAVENSKYPEKSTVRLLSWPYSFTFKKSYQLSNANLKITFEIKAEKGMPFMLGYHPAFMLNGNLDELVVANKQQISIPEIQKGGDTAYPVLNTAEISLVKKTGSNINIKTKGFHNFMLWTPASNMLCIEPITAYPYTGGEMLSKDLFNTSNGLDIFEVEIIPF
ncbi:aldose 1-epimerase [Lutibacter sp. HS1-25]|uniref:aldose epimerase family protein n=1 Tax=Lutibacter sp. HS1-25 TaxID=2485000 RepID=UPI001011E417|nr:aldose 1-epimerase [Lutibacter sp. HS1-25]RXP47052.1 aldose 1-epimerase [Lutibacter sp. HS1-25]